MKTLIKKIKELFFKKKKPYDILGGYLHWKYEQNKRWGPNRKTF